MPNNSLPPQPQPAYAGHRCCLALARRQPKTPAAASVTPHSVQTLAAEVTPPRVPAGGVFPRAPRTRFSLVSASDRLANEPGNRWKSTALLPRRARPLLLQLRLRRAAPAPPYSGLRRDPDRPPRCRLTIILLSIHATEQTRSRNARLLRFSLPRRFTHHHHLLPPLRPRTAGAPSSPLSSSPARC